MAPRSDIVRRLRLWLPSTPVVGLPGGVHSPLYQVFAAANTYGMILKTSATGGDPDDLNTVWVYDSAAFPYYDGEVYHQCHCDFRMSSGMPYPARYTRDVWAAKKALGEFVPTGCPEDVMPHPGYLCAASG